MRSVIFNQCRQKDGSDVTGFGSFDKQHVQESSGSVGAGRSETWAGCDKSCIRPVKLSDEVLVWSSVWSEVQIVCRWFSWCHCILEHRHLVPHLNRDWFTYLVGLPAYPGCPGRGRKVV